jgi:hypothetical protein
MKRKKYSLILCTDFNRFRRQIRREHHKKFDRGYVFGSTNFLNRHQQTIKTIINLPDIFYNLQLPDGRYNKIRLVSDCVRFINHEFLHGEVMQQIGRVHPEWVVRVMNGDPLEGEKDE